MKCVNNSNTAAFSAKDARLGSDEYGPRVSVPMMAAIDGMPPAYRALVNEYGYVDVYRALKRGIKPAQIVRAAAANGGLFVL
jgi:hypothetical protein